MMLIIGTLVVMLVVGGAMGGLVWWQLKKTDPSKVDTSLQTRNDTTQSILPFEDIKDSLIHLGNHQYRAIVKCSSINFDLKTDREQEIIEMSYQRFLNSLSHPISIYIQTKTVDNTKMLENLKEDIIRATEDFPLLSQYGEVYLNEMAQVNERIDNNKEKNKYIIIPFNEAVELTNSSDEEKYEYALKEIQSRCQIVIDGLQGIGVHAQILKTKDIADLVYSVYHKDNASQIDNIVNGEFLTLLTEGEDKLGKITDEGRLDWILYEAQLRLETEITNDKTMNDDVKKRALEGISELNKLRDAIAGYYKTDTDISDKINFYK